MTDQELQRLVEKISMDFFHLPFLHRANFNSRLRTTGGRYHLKTHDLDFNPLVFQMYGGQELIKVIKHELCHYHLHLAGKGYQHKDQDFKRLLSKTGGSRYVQPLVKEATHSYKCRSCGTLILRRRKINTARYVCGNCHGRLLYIETSKQQVSRSNYPFQK
ncbi:SprT family protein [Enterococcus florum]|uniref:SprT family protein n=1 Tax=Enterococcus florum TaxID=2480627 RepID=UPI0011BADDFC|nr:SprT family protein [Enterococcus florum]